MKVVLRDSTTQLFVRAVGEWTDSVETAHDFERVHTASSFVTARRLENMRIVLLLGAAFPFLETGALENRAAA